MGKKRDWDKERERPKKGQDNYDDDIDDYEWLQDESERKR